ncbi:MAG TPA: anhydro-N-acetylmuramic acid kinase [Bryobacteraceae bacterium]|jgi:anhydro-N-acetylmuramic acid kinase
MRVAGVMSGTSLDGIDVAIVDIRGKKIDTVAFRSTPYPKAVREALLNVSSVAEISRLNFLLGELYAKAVLAARQPVDLIGLHGQTVYHEGGKHTLQIGEAAVVAERTGIDVISNFREADIAAGGQGAPLVPYVDYLLFRHPRKNRVALNIGGIANITAIPAGAKREDVIAFDTGPGNMVIDALVAHWTGGRQKFDRDGRIARSGEINRSLYESLIQGSFIHSRPPKSCGREQFGAEFVRDLVATGIPMPDLIATATLLTVCSIAYQIYRDTFIVPDEVIVSGGGVHNTFLMEELSGLLPITTSAEFGIDPDAKEAIAFAVLAHESARRRPANLPSATGARHHVVLGKRSYSSVSRISAS